jgi:hypothetical protein
MPGIKPDSDEPKPNKFLAKIAKNAKDAKKT